MRMWQNFKNPEHDGDDDELDELVDDSDFDEFGGPVVVAEVGDADLDELEDDELIHDEQSDDSSEDFHPSDTDSDESFDEPTNRVSKLVPRREILPLPTNRVDDLGPSGSRAAAATSNSEQATLSELNEDEEDDETVRAIIAAIKMPRKCPPDIKLDDFITDICFHPERNIIALATITGDIALYEYTNEENTLLRTIEVHAKACRDVDFTEDGLNLISCSKDKSIMITDMETEKLKKFYESAHDEAINKLHIIDEHLFATGDDGGTIKLWDFRTKHEIFALKEVEDYISQMLTNDDKKLLIATSGDGLLTTLNIGARKLYVQSEPYEEELTCMGIYRGDSKLVTGTSKGRLYTFNWGQFGYHCDMYPGLKTPINQMIPITDRIACVAGEEGVIRACHIAPFRNLGIVGQHQMPIECLDVNDTGELIASSSHNNDVRFWNVKYFEEFGDIKYNEKHNTFKEKHNNLPSSKFSNASDFFSDLAAQPPADDDS